jgi:hypothetical protein
MGLAMLQVDHPYNPTAAHQRHGQKGFVAIFGELMEELKARIGCGFFCNRHRLAMLRYPPRNALPYAQFQPVHNFRMLILGGPKDEFLVLENIDQAGVALHQRGSEFDHAGQHFVKAIRRRQPDSDFVQQVNMRIFN